LVSPERRDRITATAARLGYQRDALVSAVMGTLRSVRTKAFRGNLALVHVPGPMQPRMVPFQREVVVGATSRAAELGFALEVFDLGETPVAPRVLARMLSARGVLGVVLVHHQRTEELTGFVWESFPVVELDHSHARPALDTVCIEHHETMSAALMNLVQRGYRRAGLFLERHKDERLRFRWSAAFRSFQEMTGSLGRIPLLVRPSLDRTAFRKWVKSHRPDVIIGHRDDVLNWLPRRAAPDFLNLNWNERTRACAGLDLRPQLQGSTLIETVVARIQRHERGPPVEPRAVMVAGRWVEGPTLRHHAPVAQL
jgi:LacI family transcriptional regulator